MLSNTANQIAAENLSQSFEPIALANRMPVGEFRNRQRPPAGQLHLDKSHHTVANRHAIRRDQLTGCCIMGCTRLALDPPKPQRLRSAGRSTMPVDLHARPGRQPVNAVAYLLGGGVKINVAVGP